MSVETHTMPNGSTVYYRSSDHAYWTGYDEKAKKCSGRLRGVSTISKHDGDASVDNLIDWAVRLAYEGVAQEASLGLSLDDVDDTRSALGWLESGPAVEREMKQGGHTWRDVRDAKGKVGSISHGVLQSLAEGATPMMRSGYDAAVIDWWKKRRPEVLDTERVTFSEEHGYAGRFDLRARITTDVSAPWAIPDLSGAVILGDAKTSGYISNSFHIQAEGYELANVECGIGASDKRVILQLKEDGSWHEWESHATPEDFLTALSAYRMGRRISNAARADWKRMKDAERVAA